MIAAGLWSRGLGRLAGARRAAAGRRARVGADGAGRRARRRDLPIVRDLDGHFYVRHYRGGLVIGAFEPGRQAARRRLHPGGLRLRRVRAGLGALRAAARQGPPPRAGARGRALRALPERAGELHAGRRLPAGRDGRGGGALRRRRPQLPGHHLRPRRRQGAGGVDRRRRADHRRVRPSTCAASPRRRPTRATCTSARARASAGSTPCTGPSCSPRRRAACGACRCTTGSPPPAPASARRPAGSAPTGTRRPARSPSTATPSAGRTGSRAAAQEHRAAREAVALFDLSSFAKFRVRRTDGARDRAARLLRGARPGARRDHVHLHAEPPGRDRARRHRHAARAGRVPRRRADRHPDQDLPLAAAPRRGRDERDRRHVGAGHAGGDGPAFARAPRGPHRRSPRRCRRSRSRRRGGSTSAGRRRSPSASPSPASLAGSCTRRSSRSCRSTTCSCAREPASACARRLPRPRLAARREGFPALGRGHGAGRHAVRGRPRLHRRTGQGDAVHRARRPARAVERAPLPAARAPHARRPGAAALPRRVGAPRRQRSSAA